MNGYDQHSSAFARTNRSTLTEASGNTRSDGRASQTRDGANRFDTSTPERRRKAMAAARRSDNPADEARLRKQMAQEANSTIDALMLGIGSPTPTARRDNRATRRGGYRSNLISVDEVQAVAEECGADPFLVGYAMGQAGGGDHGHGDWDHDHMGEAKKGLPPWLQKDGDDSGDSDSDSGSGSKKGNLAPPFTKKGRRGKVAESALNPQIRFRETVDNNGFEEAELNARRRNDLPASDFAGPDKTYPIDTPARARSAIARAKANASPALQRTIIAAVKRKYPNMDVEATAGSSSK